ncbi:RHS repeat domain-containing protein, partial [Nocardia macrotermitis]|uniref:RHS repeat domain-containing protein n=1 Tax=Nocardia macrotermitis TaxID=2585198 RepID=UPI001885D9ED
PTPTTPLNTDRAPDSTTPITDPTHLPEGRREYHNNLLTRNGRTRYHYDQAGRLIRKEITRLSRKPDIWHYRYNAFDQLTDIQTPDHQWWHYTYDALGRRTTKQHLTPDGHVIERIDFTWDENHLVEQTASTANTRWAYHPGTYTPLTQTTYQLDHREFLAIISDLVGTPTELFEPESGRSIAATKRSLWGKSNWNGAASTPLQFPGQIYDTESGLHYNHQRYYDPGSARFLTQDPLGLEPSPNQIAYPHNPINWIDPLGLACKQFNTNGKNLSDPNPVPKAIKEQYEKIRSGQGTPRVEPGTGHQKVFQGRELPNGKRAQWQGSLEWDVPGTDHRILERPDGHLGYVINHDYSSPFLFPGPWYPEGGKIPKRLGG